MTHDCPTSTPSEKYALGAVGAFAGALKLLDELID
jgi:hypothetical protein